MKNQEKKGEAWAVYLAIALTLQGVNNTNDTDSFSDSATPWLVSITCLIS